MDNIILDTISIVMFANHIDRVAVLNMDRN